MGKNMRILAEDTLAIVIDYQEKLVPVMQENETLLHNTQILIKGLQLLQIPIVVTQQYTKGIGMTVDHIGQVFGDEFVYYDKVAFSCYDDETIKEQIKKYNKKNIIVCGIEAHVCVLQTAIDLMEAGNKVVLIEDCISSRKENDKKIAVQRAISEGAVIATYESILFELTRKAGTDTFKVISKLLK